MSKPHLGNPAAIKGLTQKGVRSPQMAANVETDAENSKSGESLNTGEGA